jgi:hypothetical protein
MLNKTNYETYLIDYLQQELTPEEEQAVLVFLKENPEIQAEFECLQKTILVPDTEIHFEPKASLYREVTPTMKAVFPFKKYLAIAAAVAGLFIALFLWKSKPTPEQHIVKTSHPSQPSITPEPASSPAPMAVESTPQKETSTQPKIKTLTPFRRVQSNVQPVETPNYVQHELPHKETTTNPNPVNEVPLQTPQTPINKISNEPLLITKETTEKHSSNSDQDVMPLVANKSNTDRAVELNPKKQPTLFKVINGLLSLKHKVKKTKQTLEQTEVTVMVGNKVLFNINH